MGGLFSKLWTNGRKKDSKEASPSKGTSVDKQIPASLPSSKSRTDVSKRSTSNLNVTGHTESQSLANQNTRVNVNASAVASPPSPGETISPPPVAVASSPAAAPVALLPPLVPVPQLASEPPQVKIAATEDVPRLFKSTYETTITIPKAADDTDDYENLVQNGPAPLATIDIDTDIIDHTEESADASTDATRNIEEAVVKIQAGVRGFLTRKQLKLQKSDSMSRLDETVIDTSPIVPPPQQFTDASTEKSEAVNVTATTTATATADDDIEVIPSPADETCLPPAENQEQQVAPVLDEMRHHNANDVTHAITIDKYNQHETKQVKLEDGAEKEEKENKKRLQKQKEEEEEEEERNEFVKLVESSKGAPVDAAYLSQVNSFNVTNILPERVYEKHQVKQLSQPERMIKSKAMPVEKPHECNTYDVTKSITVDAYEKHAVKLQETHAPVDEDQINSQVENIISEAIRQATSGHSASSHETAASSDPSVESNEQPASESASASPAPAVIPEIKCENDDSDLNNAAAVKIQAAYRGYQVRKAISRESSPSYMSEEASAVEGAASRSHNTDLLTDCTAPEEMNIWDVEGDFIETKADVFAQETSNEVVHIESKKLEDKLLISTEDNMTLDDETLPPLDDKLLDLEGTPSPPSIQLPDIPAASTPATAAATDEMTTVEPPENLVESSVDVTQQQQLATAEEPQEASNSPGEGDTSVEISGEGDRRESLDDANGDNDLPSNSSFARGTSPNPTGKKKRKPRKKKTN